MEGLVSRGSPRTSASTGLLNPRCSLVIFESRFLQVVHKFLAIAPPYVRCWRQSVSHLQCSFGKDKRGLTVLKNKAIAQKLGSVMVAGLMVLTAGVAMAAAPASAATTCNSWRNQEVIDFAPDKFRAGAACTEIAADRKVRAHLNMNNATDKYSSWFTTESKSYYTEWTTCISGCTHGYQVATV